jgi:fused signal recognition particle receptor
VDGKEKQNLFLGLAKTRDFLTGSLHSVISRGGDLDVGMLDDIEDQLILSDLGVEVSREVVDRLYTKIRARQVSTVAEVRQELREHITKIVQPVARPWLMSTGVGTRVVLVVGVNGVGKTTTVAKLAEWFGRQGRSVMLAACDTFRAAAIDQLKIWGQRLEIPVVAQERGTDAAAVAHDALASARAKRIDTLIIDSAGRQHINADLMEQLKKIHRVLGRIDKSAPQETLLVVDAGNGQNVLSQTQAFHAAIALTGICVTKLDGTARGGVIVALARRFGIPIPFVAMGERLEDLAPFDAPAFARALLPEDN